jgi:hypothetical protein
MSVLKILTVAGEADSTVAQYQAQAMGIGVAPPTSGLAIGTGNKLQVDGNGNILKINNVAYSWPASQGSVGQVLTNDGSGGLTWTTAAAGVSGSGSSSQVTFWTGASAVSGDSSFWWDNSTKRLGLLTGSPAATLSIGASSQFRVDSSGNLVRVNDVPYSWPSSQGSAGQVLANDGSGSLSWTTAAASTVSGTYTCPISVAVRDVVYIAGGDTVDRANAASAGKYPVVGVVSSKPTTTSAVVQYSGEVSGFAGLTAGSTYWLGVSAGQISTSAPSSAGQAGQVVGVAKSTTTLELSISLVITV